MKRDVRRASLCQHGNLHTRAHHDAASEEAVEADADYSDILGILELIAAIPAP